LYSGVARLDDMVFFFWFLGEPINSLSPWHASVQPKLGSSIVDGSRIDSLIVDGSVLLFLLVFFVVAH